MSNREEYPVTERTSDERVAADAIGPPESPSPPDRLDRSWLGLAASSVYIQLMYGVSLPERTLRSTAAVIGGMIAESSELLIPRAFRDSRSYQTFVQQMLDTINRDVGGVRENGDRIDGESSDKVDNFIARKSVGSFIDLAGMATFHLSPALILALVSDLAYGSSTYLKEISEQLRKEGIIHPDSTIDGASDLLDAISAASGKTAQVLDTPPIDVKGLRETLQETRKHLARIDATSVFPQSEVDRLWSDMRDIAARENVNLFRLSSAMTMYTLGNVKNVCNGALTTLSVSGNLLDRHVLEHYRSGLNGIAEKGLYAIVAESSQPYVEAVWYNYAADRPTITEDLFSGRLAGKFWSGICGWFDRKPNEMETHEPGHEADGNP